MSKEYYTTKEAAEFLGISEFTLASYRQKRKKGIDRGPNFITRMYNKVLYHRDDLVKFKSEKNLDIKL